MVARKSMTKRTVWVTATVIMGMMMMMRMKMTTGAAALREEQASRQVFWLTKSIILGNSAKFAMASLFIKNDMKYFHTAPYINYARITVILTLFQKRVEFESQNTCIINVWGCAEILPNYSLSGVTYPVHVIIKTVALTANISFYVHCKCVVREAT